MRRVLWTWLSILAAACGDDSTPTGDAGSDVVAVECHGEAIGLELAAPDAPIATFHDGRAVGVREMSIYGETPVPIYAWKGLRYGRDTGGANRWRAPVPAGCQDGVYDATAFGATCMQSQRSDRDSCPPVGSEDCLFLNVFVPDPSVVEPPESGRYPVMVWIHGGNFEWGAGSLDAYQPHSLANWGVVVVTINYRVGTMGFLAHPAFGEENDGASGNYGIMDQIEALRWVQRNIDGFMGDADDVTIFGQSAGGSSSCYHVASAQSTGLFHKAILHSDGGCFTIAEETKLAHAEAIVDRVERIDGVDCGGDVAACLRNASPCALAAIDTGSYTPDGGEVPGTYAGVDGHVLTETPLESFVAGRHNHVPVIVGATNREEAWIARGSVSPHPTNESEYVAWFEMAVGDFSDVVLRTYPLSDYAEPMDGIELFFSDNKYECRQRRVRRALVGSQSEPVYSYVFAHGNGEQTFAAHGDEIPYLFGTPASVEKTFDESDWAQAIVLQAYWTQFAKTGSPNAETLPVWEPWNETQRPRLVFDNDPSPCSGLDEAACTGDCLWIPSLGCGLLAVPFEGDYRDAQCDALWEPLVPVCGDGRLQLGEECDDGNDADGDACSNACACTSAAVTGDGTCDACENAITSPDDCGGNCFLNGNACDPVDACDPTGTCR